LISADETGRPMKDVYARVFTSIDNQPSSIRFVASPNEEATPTGHVDDGRYSSTLTTSLTRFQSFRMYVPSSSSPFPWTRRPKLRFDF